MDEKHLRSLIARHINLNKSESEQQRLERARLQTMHDIDLALKALAAGEQMRKIIGKVSFLNDGEVKNEKIDGFKVSAIICDEVNGVPNSVDHNRAVLKGRVKRHEKD